MIEVPAAMTISGTLACGRERRDRERARRDAEAGEEVDLVVDDQLLRERLVLSGTAPSSLTMTSIFLPATVSPFCSM